MLDSIFGASRLARIYVGGGLQTFALQGVITVTLGVMIASHGLKYIDSFSAR
jgi:hypothetical protein